MDLKKDHPVDVWILMRCSICRSGRCTSDIVTSVDDKIAKSVTAQKRSNEPALNVSEDVIYNKYN